MGSLHQIQRKKNRKNVNAVLLDLLMGTTYERSVLRDINAKGTIK